MINGNEFLEYLTAVICNIRYGRDDHEDHLYAEIRSKDGRILVSASLNYCVERMTEVAQIRKDLAPNWEPS